MPQGKGTYGSKVGRPPKKKMGGGKMKDKPLAMKEGGRPMSEMLEDKLYERQEDNPKSRAFMTERPKRMSMGGKCRGMGAATRGGNFKMG
tara:strand:+ start:1241 stop:1510 length:270 start_codon:yes stop_codon:yes gene_type:complete